MLKLAVAATALSFSVASAVAQAAHAGAAAQSTTKPDLASGRAAYLQLGCAQCHGDKGQGTAAAPKLVPERLAPDVFAAKVRSPANRMPAYSRALASDDELGKVHAYLLSISAPP